MSQVLGAIASGQVSRLVCPSTSVRLRLIVWALSPPVFDKCIGDTLPLARDEQGLGHMDGAAPSGRLPHHIAQGRLFQDGLVAAIKRAPTPILDQPRQSRLWGWARA